MHMKKVLIGIAVGAAVVALLVFIFVQMRETTRRASAISGGLLSRYVGLLRDGAYEEAYDTCLAERYQRATSRSAFVAAQRAHVEEYGPLKGWEETIYEPEYDLFSGESVIGIRGILHYANKDVFVSYKVDSLVKPYRIRRIFGSPGTSTSLSEGIW